MRDLAATERPGRRLMTAVLSLGILSAPAAADPAAKVAEVVGFFLEVCNPALADPQAFIEAVPGWAPAGSFASMTSADGRMYKLNLTRDGFFGGYERVVHPRRGTESCNMHYNGPGLEDGTATAAALEALLRSRIPAGDITGGRYPELYPDYPGRTVLHVNEDNHQYLAIGLMDDPELFVFAQVVSGFMSLSAARTVEAGH